MDLDERDFARSLKARNLAPRTIDSYLDAYRLLHQHLDKPPADATGADLQGFLADQLARHSPSTAAIRYRSLQQFYRWALDEGVIDTSPMQGMRPPFVPETPVPVLNLHQVAALLKDCEGRTFEQRRDAAIIRLFLEPGGLRLSEMAGLHTDHLDFEQDVALVLGKGRRPRSVPFGVKTGQALGRYVRERAKRPNCNSPWLWLGSKGQLTKSGITQMLRRRAARVGIEHLHPHMLRHTAAHEWMASGGQETDAMRLFGWRSRAMLGRYGASAADERAKEASRRMSLGDRY